MRTPWTGTTTPRARARRCRRSSPSRRRCSTSRTPALGWRTRTGCTRWSGQGRHLQAEKLKDLFAKHALAEADANAAPPRGDDGEQHVTPGKPRATPRSRRTWRTRTAGASSAARPDGGRRASRSSTSRGPSRAPTESGGGAATPETGARRPARPARAPAPRARGAPDAVALAGRRLGSGRVARGFRSEASVTSSRRSASASARRRLEPPARRPAHAGAGRARARACSAREGWARSRRAARRLRAERVASDRARAEAGADGAAEPGRFAAWILAEGSMHRVTSARRVVAVATRRTARATSARGRVASRRLPRAPRTCTR